MPPADREAFARRGQEYYDKFLRAKLEPAHRGEFLYLDVETGEYELDADEVAAMERATANHPDSFFYIRNRSGGGQGNPATSPPHPLSACGLPLPTS
jgi:hypothetical protein